MNQIYVAGGSSEAASVGAVIERLRSSGFVITYDWTRDVLTHFAEGAPPLTAERRLACAEADVRGIDLSDLVWWVVPEKLSEGSAWEAGYAKGRGKRVIASGPTTAQHRLFPDLADEVFQTHAAALEWVIGSSSPDLVTHKHGVHGRVNSRAFAEAIDRALFHGLRRRSATEVFDGALRLLRIAEIASSNARRILNEYDGPRCGCGAPSTTERVSCWFCASNKCG